MMPSAFCLVLFSSLSVALAQRTFYSDAPLNEAHPKSTQKACSNWQESLFLLGKIQATLKHTFHAQNPIIEAFGPLDFSKECLTFAAQEDTLAPYGVIVKAYRDEKISNLILAHSKIHDSNVDREAFNLPIHLLGTGHREWTFISIERLIDMPDLELHIFNYRLTAVHYREYAREMARLLHTVHSCGLSFGKVKLSSFVVAVVKGETVFKMVGFHGCRPLDSASQRQDWQSFGRLLYEMHVFNAYWPSGVIPEGSPMLLKGELLQLVAGIDEFLPVDLPGRVEDWALRLVIGDLVEGKIGCLAELERYSFFEGCVGMGKLPLKAPRNLQ